MHLEQQHAEFGPETSDASLVDRTVDSEGQITESSPVGSRRAKSPSQRRLTAVLKAEKAGASGATTTAESSAPGSSRSRSPGSGGRPHASMTNQPTSSFKSSGRKSPSRTSRLGSAKKAGSIPAFLSFSFGWGGKNKDDSPEMPKKVAPKLSEKEASALYTRLYNEKKEIPDKDPEETFKPKISKKSLAIGAKVHARESGRMDRVAFLVKKGTEELRERKHENGLLMDPDRSAGDVRTVPPNEWFMDSFGRLSKTGDRYVRSIRKAEDDRIAEGCTFKPTLSKATRELVRNTPYLQHTNFYDRGLEWQERKKRAIAAQAKARENEEERECTFRPRTAGNAPAFVRRIAAKKRAEKMMIAGADPDDPDDLLDGLGGAIASATSRSKGWLPPTQRPKKWEESLGASYDPDEPTGAVGASTGRPSTTPGIFAAWETPGGVNGALVEVGTEVRVVNGIVLPQAPADHPGARSTRKSGHVPLHSSSSHYKRRDEGVNEVDKLEDEKIQSPDRVDDLSAGGVSPDYFEKLHLERVQKARIQEQEKVARLYKHDGKNWENRVTKPKPFNLGKRIGTESDRFRALRRPVSARLPGSSLTASVSSLKNAVYRDADEDPPGFEAYFDAVGRRGPPGWNDQAGHRGDAVTSGDEDESNEEFFDAPAGMEGGRGRMRERHNDAGWGSYDY